MMLRFIYLLGVLTFLQISASDVPTTSVRVVKTVSSSVSSEVGSGDNVENTFETAHKIAENREFQTSHKITNERPIIKLLEDQVKDDLMQQQNPQTLLSTKERPELNPVLSALINEDVMKSIESKRAVEDSIQVDSSEASSVAPPAAVETDVVAEEQQPSSTAAPVNILTTSQRPAEAAVKDDDIMNEGLVDQSVNLEEAGSENNQKSRIQIKKGPNGVDYEYEYVYYYYDEDEKNDKGKQKSTGIIVDATASTTRDSTTRGKSRYTNIDRSTTSNPENEVAGRGRGRAGGATAGAEVEEGRLPQNTRFPPRSRGADVTPAPEGSDANSEKSGRRTGVKRPSLDLVDSDTFNTDEKQVKTNRNIESEQNKKSSEASAAEIQGHEEDSIVQTTNSDLEVEDTTPLMEKAALDLYAIIANENFNMDATTGDGIDITTTDLPTTDADEMTTVIEEESTTTTTTTTTEATTTTTTTTTTTPAPAVGGRKGHGAGGRNRFRLKNGSTTTSTEAPAESSKASGKSKASRFGGRPTFGSGRARPHKEVKEEVKEEVVKDEAKPSSSSSLRGRTRNRFNLRGSTSSTEKSADENTIDSKPASTTARTLRARPQLNIRGRGRPTATTAPSPSENESEGEKEKVTTPAVPRPSRFNLGRPGAGGANRLLPRGRINPLKPAIGATAAKDGTEGDAAETKAEDGTGNEAASAGPSTDAEGTAAESTEDKAGQEVSPTIGGLNRLKSRPKIQVTAKAAKASPPAIVRRPNPLIGRRRIGSPSSTTEAPASEDGAGDGGDDENVTGDSEDPKDEAASVAAVQVVEASSEQPAVGLSGLLASRRRLPLRKPGTLN